MGQAEIAFGTSGLRGPATGFDRASVAAYVAAFLETCCGDARERTAVVGADLRASSPAIVGHVQAALARLGWSMIDAGQVPTPALASYALARALPAIMVTGSHIPPAYNGLKFYRPDGEMLKSDEAPVRERAEFHLARSDDSPVAHGASEAPDPAIARAYAARYTGAFAPDTLAGLKVGVLEHSAVGRDLVTEILTALGAQCLPFARAASFVAVDTEALEPDLDRAAQEMLSAHGLDTVVSTDGDGDRPLLIDERGNQINGDVLGAITARLIGARTIVTPLTSTSAIEASSWFETVVRTRIGSPFVVEAMRNADGPAIVGFEANGGFLVQTPLTLPGGMLAPLPTRDAVLPIVATLSAARDRAVPVSELVADLPARVMKADRLQSVPPRDGKAFTELVARSAAERAALHADLEDPVQIDTRDGTRMTLADGRIVHFRQSGNAPELRCYVETESPERTGRLLAEVVGALRVRLNRQEPS